MSTTLSKTDVAMRLGELGLAVWPFLDWKTNRPAPAFCSTERLLATLRRKGDRVFEYGPGNLEGAALWASCGASVRGIACHRISYGFTQAIEVGLLDACRGSVSCVGVSDAARGIAGEALAPEYGRCPRPGEIPTEEGWALFLKTIEKLEVEPLAVLPMDYSEIVEAGRDGEVYPARIAGDGANLLRAIGEGRVKIRTEGMLESLEQDALVRLTSAKVHVGDFSEWPEAMGDGGYQLIVDSRALAHHPSGIEILSDAVQRLDDGGLAVSDAPLEAYSYRLKQRELVKAAAEATIRFNWWLVLGPKREPEGVVVTRGWGGKSPHKALSRGRCAISMDPCGYWQLNLGEKRAWNSAGGTASACATRRRR